MRFGPFRVGSLIEAAASFKQLELGLRSLSSENFALRGVLESVLKLPLETWEPNVTGSFLGSQDATYSAWYVKLHHLIYVNFKVEITTSGAASNVFTVSLPFTAKIAPQTSQLQVLSCAVEDGAGAELGLGLITEGDNKMDIYRYDKANFGTGAGRQLIGSGWYIREL